MRKLLYVAAVTGAVYGAMRWWRDNRRFGASFVNQTVNPWLVRRGLIGESRGELALIEHVGRSSGTIRRTPIHPMATAGGFRIIVPVGERSEWARNVIAAGHCRLLLGERVIYLDEPELERPSEIPGLPGPIRALFEWLGFRFLHLKTLGDGQADVPVPTIEGAAAEHVAVPA